MNYKLQHEDKAEPSMDCWKAMNIIEGFAFSQESDRLTAAGYLIKTGQVNDRVRPEIMRYIRDRKIDASGNIL